MFGPGHELTRQPFGLAVFQACLAISPIVIFIIWGLVTSVCRGVLPCGNMIFLTGNPSFPIKKGKHLEPSNLPGLSQVKFYSHSVVVPQKTRISPKRPYECLPGRFAARCRGICCSAALGPSSTWQLWRAIFERCQQKMAILSNTKWPSKNSVVMYSNV